MIATQKIKRPTAVLPSLNLTQTANKCENGFFLRTIRFEIFGIKHLKLKNMLSQQSEPYILTRKKKKKRSGSSEAVHQAIVIERLLAYSSILELAMRHSVLGKDILRVFLSHVKATYSLWWSSLTKDLKKKVVLCVGVVRQTQSA